MGRLSMSAKISKSKKTYHHGALHQALIDAGLTVLASEGLDALSLRRVARDASVSAAAPYRHFKDKQSLLAAISHCGFLQLQSALDESGKESPGNLDKCGQAYLSFAIQNPQLYRLMFSLHTPPAPHAVEDTQSVKATILDSIARIITEGVSNKIIVPECIPHELALSTWSLIHGVTLLEIDGFLANSDNNRSAENVLKFAQSYLKTGWQPPQ